MFFSISLIIVCLIIMEAEKDSKLCLVQSLRRLSVQQQHELTVLHHLLGHDNRVV